MYIVRGRGKVHYGCVVGCGTLWVDLLVLRDSAVFFFYLKEGEILQSNSLRCLMTILRSLHLETSVSKCPFLICSSISL